MEPVMQLDDETELRRNLATGQLDRVNRIHAAVYAKRLGLEPSEFAKQFPGNHITVQLPPEPTIPPAPRKGLSTLAALGLGALGIASPVAAGVIGYLLNTKPAITNTLEKIVEKPIEKIITTPGQNYDVDVDMEVIPPK
jgi:hypothetical protein